MFYYIQVIVLQLYYIISATSLWAREDTLFQVLQWQKIFDPALPLQRTIILWLLQVDGLRKSVNIVLCQTQFITLIFTLHHFKWNIFELEWSIGKYSLYCKVKRLVELIAYDTEWVDNTRCSEMEHWMHLLNNW